MSEVESTVKPLSQRTRQRTFLFLVLVFCVAIPTLYMYATGYRLDLKKPTNFVSTGGLSITVPLTETEMYIDDELVQATRTFRRAFYAQGIDVGTHKIHVQKDGYHTWVKELPVSKHLVTEAEVFNLPIVPQLRVIAPWQTATGTMVVTELYPYASTTNPVLATTTATTSKFIQNPEYLSLISNFGTTSTSSKKESTAAHIRDIIDNATNGTTTETVVETATSTIVQNEVKLYREGDDVYARWVGSFDRMPYYYCAPDFPRYSTATASVTPEVVEVPPPVVGEIPEDAPEETPDGGFVVHPVQVVPENTSCEPTIRIDRKWQTVHDFKFYPGDNDLVLTVLDDGIYVVEIDDRSWQNVQPLMMGSNLRVYIEGSAIYVYDGKNIYNVLSTIATI